MTLIIKMKIKGKNLSFRQIQKEGLEGQWLGKSIVNGCLMADTIGMFDISNYTSNYIFLKVYDLKIRHTYVVRCLKQIP